MSKKDQTDFESITKKEVLRDILGGYRLKYGTVLLDIGLLTYIVLLISNLLYRCERPILGAFTFILHISLLLLGIWCGER